MCVCEGMQPGRWDSKTEENAHIYASWPLNTSRKQRDVKKICMLFLQMSLMWILSSSNWWKSLRDAFSATSPSTGDTPPSCSVRHACVYMCVCVDLLKSNTCMIMIMISGPRCRGAEEEAQEHSHGSNQVDDR